MILEAVMLNVKPDQANRFEEAFMQASPIIRSASGYLSHALHRCLECDGKYMLLVRWRTLEDHTVGFRRSAAYQEWKRLLHHFYDPFPVVEHFIEVEIKPE
jgi:heme-degrading monooxygenase HmoA